MISGSAATSRWESEDQLLHEMSLWEPLPDEDDPRWDVDADPDGAWIGIWAQLKLVLDAADAAGAHRWRRVALEVFAHASSWDANGAMGGIRHGAERAFLDDTPAFAVGLEPLTWSRRAGTRLWVARELGILREIASLPHLLRLLDDSNADVAEQAQDSIDMLAQVHASVQQHASLAAATSERSASPVEEGARR